MALLGILTEPVFAQGPWTATALGTLGGTTSSATDVNDAGQVVGSSQTASGLSHAFIWTLAGGMVDLGTLGGLTSSASGVNNSGQVVGFSTTAAGQSRAFLWTAATGMIDLGTLAGTASSASDINDAGVVTGSSSDATGASKAFRWTAETGMVDLGTLGGGAFGNGAAAINSVGWIVGSSSSATACTGTTTCNGWTHAFLWKPGTGMADIGFLVSRFTEGNALGLNNPGQVVGYIEHAFAVSADAAFSWTAATGMVRVSTLGGTENRARDVNDSGLIVGSSFLAGDLISHAFAGKVGATMVDLGTLGGTSSGATAVNNAGVIVGSAATASGVSRAVVWYPAAPFITRQPLNLHVTPATAATFVAAASRSPTATVQWQVSTNGGSTFLNISGATAATYSFTAAASDTGKRFRAIFTNTNGSATTVAATLTVSATLTTMSIEKTSLMISAVTTGAAFTARTAAQTIRLVQTGTGTVTWTAVSTAPWLVVSPTSGNGSTTLTVSAQFAAGLAASQTGRVNLTLTGADNAVSPITVTLTIVSSTAAASPAFGVFDTPASGPTVLAGSIAVTGWALDNVGVNRVEIWRDLQAGETTPPFASTPSDPRNGKVFISNATFVNGARPDVEALYLTTPFSYRAGWGYLLLTWGLWNQGNGTYTLRAFAFDQEDNVSTLGSKTIVVSNNAATKPFGSIDTPAIGGDASGPNFGWGLTPKVNGVATCKIQPSGVQVSIDSGPLQPVVYGDNRTDIAGAFTGFSNTGGAGGHYIFDWSTLANGPHTIGWLITDDCNRADGVGSRFFNVTTGTNLLAGGPGVSSAVAAPNLSASTLQPNEPESAEPISVARGYGELPEIVTPGLAGSRVVEVAQGERIEIRAPRGFETAYQIVNGGVRRVLPSGASWDAASGTFSWQPAAGFLGRFRLVFSNGVERISVRVIITP